MATILGNPGLYIQGYGELGNLCKYARTMGDKIFIIISQTGKDRFLSTFEASQQEFGGDLKFAIFQGECCITEIQRLTDECQSSCCNLVIGVGGGKALDTAKAVAAKTKTPLIIVPSSAATDAPCLAVSVIYSEDGVFETYMEHVRHPDIVLVDSEVICKAPLRLFAAGIGDALSTYFEARACKRSNAINGVGGLQTLSAMKLAELCFETILTDSYNAYLAVKNACVTTAVEHVIEANIYLSGIGAEGSGDAGAHGIHNALTKLASSKDYYHGELVAFGTLVQLVLENESQELMEKIQKLLLAVHLPITLDAIGVDRDNLQSLSIVAEAAIADTLTNMPFRVSSRDVIAAMLVADELGREITAEYQPNKVSL